MSATAEELEITVTQKTLRMPTGIMQPVGIGAVGHPLQWDDPGICLASETKSMTLPSAPSALLRMV